MTHSSQSVVLFFRLISFFLLFLSFVKDKSSSSSADELFSLQLLSLWHLFICCSSVGLVNIPFPPFLPPCLSLCHSCGPVVMSSVWQSLCFWQCLHVSVETSIPHLHLFLSTSKRSFNSLFFRFHSAPFYSTASISSASEAYVHCNPSTCPEPTTSIQHGTGEVISHNVASDYSHKDYSNKMVVSSAKRTKE